MMQLIFNYHLCVNEIATCSSVKNHQTLCKTSNPMPIEKTGCFSITIKELYPTKQRNAVKFINFSERLQVL